MSLRADAVTVREGGATLLREATLDVRRGEVVAVVGPNGAGKSTLLRVLAGDRAPDAGSASMDGRAVRAWTLAERARRRAVVGGDDEAAFAWRVRDIVLIGRTPFHDGNPTARDQAIVEGALADLDALPLADRGLRTLSTGERQRVALARGLAQVWPDDPGAGAADPAWLLLDEPTANLDPRHQALAMQRLRARAAQGAGVLVVLHDLNLAAAHADRIALMRSGRVVEVGAPASVLRPELLEAVFEVPMLVLAHPRSGQPLVVPAGTDKG